MTFTIGDPITPLATLLNQAVDEGVAYTDAQLAVVDWTIFTPTASTDWTAGTCRYRQFGPIVETRLFATYTGATLTAASDGNITNKQMFTGVGFPAGTLPSDNQVFRGYKSSSGPVGGRFYTNGMVYAEHMYPTDTLASGVDVSVQAIYMVG